MNDQRFHAGECFGIEIVDILDVEHRLAHFEDLRDFSFGDGKEGELLQEFDAQVDATGADQLRVLAELLDSVDEDPLQHITQLQLNIYLLITCARLCCVISWSSASALCSACNDQQLADPESQSVLGAE